ncbi:hypothetical protein R3P38DRAFT_3198597 [Favolaschia claudopus]|uniref:Uncharacterized protein n=1 Tax=Favolaschia claudopus TaxID=2862362 RepID=A0AAW0B236_9AGAR
MARDGKKKKAKKNTDAPQARGNPGDFRGSRREFLKSRVPEYLKHSDEHSTRDFWPGVWRDYWSEYPWDLAINEEPPPDWGELGKADSELTADELTQKNDIKDKVQAKIKRWFSYARHSGKGGVNPFAKWLGQLRRVDERAPKRLALHQVYMQDEEKNDEINRLLKERHPELVGRQNSIKERTAIARELLEAEEEEIREEYRLRGEEEYQEAMEEFKGGEEAVADAEEDAEARHEARERLGVTVQPLLDSIRAITGSQVLLVTGVVVNGRFDVRTLHGKAEGKQGLDFTKWDTGGFKGVVDQWMRYLIAAAAEPDASGPTKPLDRASNTAPPPPAAEQSVAVEGAAQVGASGEMVVDKDNEVPAQNDAAATGAQGGDVDGGGGGGGEDEQQEEEEVVAPELDRMVGVGEPLKRAVRALTPTSRDARVFELAHMSEFYRNRENNKAMALEKLEELGIKGQVQGLMDELRTANKRRPVEEGGRARVKRTKTKASPNDDDNYGSSDDDDDEEDRASTPKPAAESDTRPRPQRLTRGRAKATADAPNANAPVADADASAPVNDANADAPNANAPATDAGADAPVNDANAPANAPVTDANAPANAPATDADAVAETDAPGAASEIPKWAPHSRKLLETGEGGEVWNRVVNAWWKREEKARFKGPKSGAAAKDRPGEIKGWIARARVGGPQPPIKDLFTFSGTWWNWWMKLNPSWREKAYDGRRLLKAGEGEWELLTSQTGPNGLLNALICLRWWRDVLAGTADGREIKEWAEAVNEVDWVLNEIS